MTVTMAVADTAGGAAVLAAGAATAWLAARQRQVQRDHARLYGQSRGLRLRWPPRRVPGVPVDGTISSEEQAVFAAIEAAGRRKGRRRG